MTAGLAYSGAARKARSAGTAPLAEPPAVPPAKRVRVHAFDAARGVAVALMILDHVLLLTAPASLLRDTLTRASLPLFMLVAGALYRGPRGRHWQLLPAGVVCSALWAVIGAAQVDVLLLIWAGFVLLAAADTLGVPRLLLLVLAVVQPVTWPAPWPGYQLGTVVALLLVGTLVPGAYLELFSARWLRPAALLGRYPLSLYVGHLLVLALVMATP